MPKEHVVAGTDLSTGQLHDILRLRTDVFVVEQACAYPEVDGRDLEADTEHVWIEDDVGITAYIRLLTDDDAIRIGRVVTRSDRRGRQLSARLITSTLHRLGPIRTRLEAQTHLVDYYRRFGYEPDGAEYVEDGIPHTPMIRPAPQAEPATK
jgi:ElaA protein